MAFPAPHIHPSQTAHTHTIILLHGCASDGPKFAEDFLAAKTSRNNRSLPDCLPSWRWVFPHPETELQVEGLEESVAHILDLLEKEIRLLDGKASHMYLDGISQGMATALWAVEDIIQRQQPETADASGLDAVPGKSRLQHLVTGFFVRKIGDVPVSHADAVSILTTPVLLGHGSDDAWVAVELGQQTVRFLQEAMGEIDVEGMEYSGAEVAGHWIKEPEEFDRILAFLEGDAEGEANLEQMKP
ncbi:Alpha/Beta hydrolase protein [Aspergillus recurvatus]